jgi:hypothetical protein
VAKVETHSMLSTPQPRLLARPKSTSCLSSSSSETRAWLNLLFCSSLAGDRSDEAYLHVSSGRRNEQGNAQLV